MKKFLSLMAYVLIAQPIYADPLQELDQYIEQARLDNRVPGVSVVIVQGDKIIFVKGYGICQIGKDKKVDENTIFQLASASKTFTSAGLGIQVDLEKLKWDDQINQHLPPFVLKDPYPTRYATSRDLLAHRTGLPAFRGDLLGKLGYSPEEILFRIRFIEPGASFREKALYSNVGFFIAGELLAKLTNTSFQEAIKKSLFEPLKMSRSGFGENLGDSNIAFSHAVIDGKVQVIQADKSTVFAAAGGVTSTAQNMGHWIMMHLNEGVFEGHQILKAETINAMHLPSMVGEVSFTETPPINKYSSFGYGLGWDNYNYRGKYVVEKAGALDGIRSIITLVPELSVGIVVLSNLNLSFLPELIRTQFLKLYVGDDGKDFKAEFAKGKQMVQELLQSPKKPNDALPFSHELRQCTGLFENELYGTFAISQKEDGLTLTAGPAHHQGSLTHFSNDTFVLEWPTINTGNEFATFTFGEDGHSIEMQTETLGRFKWIP